MILFGTISIYKTVLCFGKKVGAGEMPKPTLHLGLCQLSWDGNLAKIGIELHLPFFLKQKVLELESADPLNV